MNNRPFIFNKIPVEYHSKKKEKKNMNNNNNDNNNNNMRDQIHEKIEGESKFWVEDPTILFKDTNIIPNNEKDNIGKLNALTRVIIIITIIMYVLKFPIWWFFLIVGLLVVVLMRYIIKYHRRERQQREYLRNPSDNRKKTIIKWVKSINDPNDKQLNIIPKPY